ncbi:MAG: hypothetical protein GX625_00525 [Clostridiaceae bacterium]|nr:hypothetical protein [Clostridiaceae bacterium]
MPRYKDRFKGKQTVPLKTAPAPRHSSHATHRQTMMDTRSRKPITMESVIEMIAREERQARISS